MAFGFGVLRHSARDFWAMTPHELHYAAEGVYGKRTGALGRNTLAELMRAFPDEA